MKKFKIIEESRFLDQDDMSQIKGGGNCVTTYMIVCKPHRIDPCAVLHTCGSYGECSLWDGYSQICSTKELYQWKE